jgi:molybdopterin-guanine dinucleotide biosynthesis protein A
VVVPRTGRGYEPLCATWAAASAGPIRRRIDAGEFKAADAIGELRAEILGPELLAACGPQSRMFVNVNTPHDYAQAQRVLNGAEMPDAITDN